jgi:tetratricopeptide (TPR) repeat protein
MRSWLLVSLAFASLPASAAPLDKYAGTPGDVTISGPIDVPLQESPGGNPYAYVWVKFGADSDKGYLAQLSSDSQFHYMSSDLADELGLKVHTGNKKLINWKGEDHKGRLGVSVNYVDVDEVRIGDLVLKHVRVITSEPLDKDEKEKQELTVEPKGLSAGLTLSLPALEQLGWAVLPSDGVVRFVPAKDAASLVQSVGSEIPYTSREVTRERFGKRKDGRFYHPSVPILVDAKIGGVDSPRTALVLDVWAGTIDAQLELTGATYLQLGDASIANTSASIGGMAPVPTTLFKNPINGFVGGYVADMVTASLGSEVLSSYDFAADPANHTIALRPVSTPKRDNPTAAALAAALKDIEKPADDAKDEKKKSDEPDEEWKPKPKDLTKVAYLYANLGDLPNALANHKRVTEIKPRKCDGWQNVGETQAMMGDFQGALASFQQASTLYHAWWDLPVEQREDLEKELNKLEEKEREAAENYAQPAGCFKADGQMAAAALALSNYDQVAQTYKDKLDLDPGLAVTNGSMELVRGNLASAQASFRQAVKMSNDSKWGDARLGVGITYAESGDWVSAKELFNNWFAAGIRDDVDPLSLWLSYVRKYEGADASVAAIRKVASENPLSAEFTLAWFREALRAGKADEAAQAKARLDTILAWAHNNEPRRTFTWSNTARYLATLGDVAGAAQAADKAVQLQPQNDDAWEAKFEVAMLQGNAQEAQAALVRASTLGEAGHPTNALVRRTLAQGQIPDWLVPPVAK